MKKETQPRIKHIAVRLFIGIPTITFFCTLLTGILFVELWDALIIDPNSIEIGDIDYFFQRWRIIFSILLTFSFIVGLFLAYYITTPLRLITQNIRNFLEGEELHPLDLQNPDELGELSVSYNHIVEHVRTKLLNEKEILDSMYSGILFVSSQLEVFFMNEGARRLLKYQGPLPISLNRIIRMKENPVFYCLFGQAKSHETIEEEEIEVRKNTGELQNLSISISEMKKSLTDQPTNYILSLKDPSQIHAIRKQLLQAEQLAIVGGLSAGIAHEIKNPLGSIKGLLQLLEEDLEDHPKSEDYFQRLHNDVSRIDKVVKNVLTFSQAKDLELHQVDVNQIVKSIVRSCEIEFRDKKIKTYVSLCDSKTPFYGDFEKLYSALLNIIKNGFEIMEKEHTMMVNIRIKPVKPFLNRSSFIIKNYGKALHFDTKQGYEIEIANTGSILTGKQMERLFDPFFTSKENGTGLGLAIAKQVIDAHCGTIKAENRAEKVCFHIYLPMIQIREDGS